MDNCGSFAMPRPLRMSALLLGGISLFSLATPALAQDSAVLDRLEAMEDRLDALQDENAALRAQIEAMLGTPVYLDLHVKVAKDWQRDPRQLRKLGF